MLAFQGIRFGDKLKIGNTSTSLSTLLSQNGITSGISAL
jgi:hypothetical protein